MARALDRGARRRRGGRRGRTNGRELTARERSELRIAERERAARRAAEREALERTAERKRAQRKRHSDAAQEAPEVQQAAAAQEPVTAQAVAAAQAPGESAVAAPTAEPRSKRRRDGAPATTAPRAVPVVEFRDVSKVYDGGVVGLERASISIGRGEFVFLVGPTGCGKSTCVRLLLHEIEPSEGKVLVSGHDLVRMPRRKVPHLRRNIGTVFQDFKLLPNRTVYANVAYSLEVIGESRASIRRKVPDILRLVGLSTKLHAYPDELSGGEQQRVSIARAFVNHPPLLLADEPTGNLDPETSIGIMQLIYRINRTGTTVIVATHDREMVDKMRRRVIELRDGRVIRDQATGLYRPEDESTSEFGVRLRGEMGLGVEGHPN